MLLSSKNENVGLEGEWPRYQKKMQLYSEKNNGDIVSSLFPHFRQLAAKMLSQKPCFFPGIKPRFIFAILVKLDRGRKKAFHVIRRVCVEFCPVQISSGLPELCTEKMSDDRKFAIHVC